MAALVAASLGLGAGPVGVTVPVPVDGTDPQLAADLEGVIATSPEDTCLAVSIDGVEVFAHRGDDLQVPASNEKLLTAAATLALLDADAGYETRLVTSAPVVDGVVRGDVVLVGSGDPSLDTAFTRAVRQVPAARPSTLLDGLADQLEEAGIRRIDGRVLGDEARYDDLRVVPSWPVRHAAENQSGPLSALALDDGIEIELVDGELRRVRADDPPLGAVRALSGALFARGIALGGEPSVGRAPEGAAELAVVTSPPRHELVADMLRRSDNQAAELMLKELGVAQGEGGSTAGGARVVASWAAEAGVAGPGSVVADGSGLDTGNQVTCRELVGVIDAAGGAGSTLDASLAVAGESGTLSARFTTTDAVGVLRGKTGSLNAVTSLAGLVTLPDGGTATFAYIVNGAPPTAEVMRAQDFLAQVLASYRPPCPDGDPEPFVGPAGAELARVGGLAAAPLAAALPGVVAAMDVLEAEADAVVDRCSAGPSPVLAPIAPDH